MSTPQEHTHEGGAAAPDVGQSGQSGEAASEHAEGTSPSSSAQTKTAQAAAAEAFADAQNLGESEPGPAAAESAEPASPEQLQAENEALRAQVAAQQEDVLRAQAEADNVRKRAQREIENAHKFGVEKLVNELLPVRDSLELGLAAAGDEGVDVKSVREGLELTLKMLNTATEKFGLVEVNPLNEAFDPDLHQAISMQEVDGAESGTVLNVVQKGYTLNDRLVRPAMVIVSK